MNVPVAINCRAVAMAIDGLAGVIAMDVKAGALTVTPELAPADPEEAAIVDTPGLFPVTSPVVLTAATEGLDELHCTEAVTSCIV